MPHLCAASGHGIYSMFIRPIIRFYQYNYIREAVWQQWISFLLKAEPGSEKQRHVLENERGEIKAELKSEKQRHMMENERGK